MMSRVCPKPCSRLATAAVFIAVGVVQLLVGVILLRSEYADLLSGPDFMTAATNIGVGCVYGVTASIWKINRKRKSVKRAARRNVLSSLLISIITVNTTTTLILLMSEGNKLLSLHLDGKSRQSSAAFGDEVLASAYITSVCSPIVCLVVAIVALSGNCFQGHRDERDLNKNDSISKVENSYGWVFDPQLHSTSKVVSDFVQSSSSSSNPPSTTSEDNVFSTNAVGSTSMKRKSIFSIRNIPSPVHTWTQKRARLLRDDSLSRHRAKFDACLQNPAFQDGSYGLIPRIKGSSIIKKQQLQKAESFDILQYNRSNKLSKEKKPLLSTNSCQPAFVETEFRGIRSNSYCNAILGGNDINHETKLRRTSLGVMNGISNSISIENTSGGKYNGSRSSEQARTRKNYLAGNSSSSSTCVGAEVNFCLNDEEVEEPAISKLKAETLKELKKRVMAINDSKIPYAEDNKTETSILKQPGEKESDLNVPFTKGNDWKFKDVLNSEQNSSPNGVFDSILNNNKRDNKNRSAIAKLKPTEQSLKFIPSHSPKPLASRYKARDDEGNLIGRIGSKAFNFSQSEFDSKHEFQTSEGDVLSPLYCDRDKLNNNIVFDCPEKRRDMSRKMSSMASIAEIPFEEGNNDACIDSTSSARISKRTTSFDDPRDIDENSNIKLQASPHNRGRFSERIPNRKQSAPTRGILKRIWSSAGPEAKINLSNLIVDKDSLIGLSEEELIARTSRIRSLRKVVEERLKSEIEN